MKIESRNSKGNAQQVKLNNGLTVTKSGKVYKGRVSARWVIALATETWTCVFP